MISVAIPTYECGGKADEFMRFHFTKFLKQTYSDFELVISDHSQDDVVKNVCDEYKDKLNISYIKNDYGRGSIACNTNKAMEHCSGDVIKILFLDDFLWNDLSLELIDEAFDSETNWLVTACEHTKDNGKTFYRPFYPTYNNNIHLGNNTISNPSVLTIRNTDDKLYFDERLNWLVDCDYYKRLFDKYGLPKIVNVIGIAQRIHSNQLTQTLGDDIKKEEYNLMVEKHG